MCESASFPFIDVIFLKLQMIQLGEHRVINNLSRYVPVAKKKKNLKEEYDCIKSEH